MPTDPDRKERLKDWTDEELETAVYMGLGTEEMHEEIARRFRASLIHARSLKEQRKEAVCPRCGYKREESDCRTESVS